MIALIINGLLLLGFGVAAKPSEILVLGNEAHPAALISDRQLMPSKRCQYGRSYALVQAVCQDLGFDKIPRNLPSDVQVLDFTKNRLTELKNDTFSAYTSLAYLYLPENFILTIEEGAFSKLKNLQALELSRNAISCFPMSTLALPKLRKLYLSDMLAKKLGDGAFQPTSLSKESNLEFVELSGNALTRIPEFGILTSLTELNVSRNSIKTVTTKELAAFCSLKILDLSKNPIEFDSNTCDCHFFNAWIKARDIKMKPEKFNCLNEDVNCVEMTSENPIFPNETMSVFNDCREIIEVRVEAAKARSTWILVVSCVATSLACLFIVLCCIHKRNKKKKKRQRLKHEQQQQQFATNNANTELLNGNMTPEQT